MNAFLKRLFTQLGRFAWLGRCRSLAGLHSVAETLRILERERVRADRNHDEFSLIAFSVRNPKTDEKSLVHLSRVLQRRLRVTDDAGWLSPTCIGAVLPHTPARGAWTVADDVCLSFPARIPLPACKIYHYPTEETEGREAEHSTGSQSDYLEPVQPMEPLFVRPVPAWKRGLDVAGAAVGLLVLAPLLLVTALAIKLSSPGPVLFRQQRRARGGRSFTMLKFRSMTAGAEEQKEQLLELSQQDGPAFKLAADPRVTPVGRFLRASSIDELPQLWNVLRGDMSLVGPRPLPCGEADACAHWQRRRLDVNPGLTCIWQVRGRSRVSFAKWMRMDLTYIRRHSLRQDLKLILQTLPALLLRRGL
jgi:lipopolysaccharide/colanic/teichoic acid biosynthesis glycosyltransferase